MKLVEIEVATKDVTNIKADFVILKNGREGLVGPELAVDNALGGRLSLYNKSPLTNIGSVELVTHTGGIAAKNIILVGVGSGTQLRYDTINIMCSEAIEAIFKYYSLINNATIATVSHGVGWV